MNELLKEAFELHNQNKLKEAEQIYNQVLKDEPNNIDALNLLFNLKHSLGETQKALDISKKIINIDPTNKSGLFNCAIISKTIGNFEVAIKYYKKVLELYPNTIEANYNIASLYADIGNMPESIKYYNKVLELNPDDKETKYFVAIAYMKNRQYKEGLEFFENRLCRNTAVVSQKHTYPKLMEKSKLWQGECVKDKTIYTYYEAGFGDVLMFARYLPLLQERCKKIILKPQTPLAELFIENFPKIHVMKYFEPEASINFDYHIPILSLPYALGMDENTLFVHKDKYLKANQEKVKSFKEKFFNNDSFKIGIKWQGNTMYDWERVIDVEQFKRLIAIPNTKFYSFQMDEGSERGKILNIDDIGKELNNFSDTAAAIENLDLVICNDTSLAHIAGAMGKPCWILLPYLYNWRWHQDLSKCDWYDSVKLFRQNTPRDWKSVFDKLYKELTKILNN